MAARHVLNFQNVTTGTGLKTLAQLASPASQRPLLVEFTVTFDGTSATATPVLVELRRQTSAGTGGVSTALVPWEEADPTASTTGLVGPGGATWTAEPTAGVLLSSWRVPPTSGMTMQYPLGREPKMAISGRLALVVTAAVAVNATGYLVEEES